MNQIDRTIGPKLLGGDAVGLNALTDDHRLHGFAPVNTVHGRAGYAADLLEPLRAAFPHGEERCDIRLGGQYKDGDWIVAAAILRGCLPPHYLASPPLAAPRWCALAGLNGMRAAELPKQS